MEMSGKCLFFHIQRTHSWKRQTLMSKYHLVITSSIHQDIGNHKSKRSAPCRVGFNSQLTATFSKAEHSQNHFSIFSHLSKQMFYFLLAIKVKYVGWHFICIFALWRLQFKPMICLKHCLKCIAHMLTLPEMDSHVPCWEPFAGNIDFYTQWAVW